MQRQERGGRAVEQKHGDWPAFKKKEKKGEDEKGKAQKQRNKASGRADPDREEDDKVFT